jgi:hypothetical protein
MGGRSFVFGVPSSREKKNQKEAPQTATASVSRHPCYSGFGDDEDDIAPSLHRQALVMRRKRGAPISGCDDNEFKWQALVY